MAESIIREDGERVVIEEIGQETLRSMDENSSKFYMPEGWTISGDTATALIAPLTEDGDVRTERYLLTMTIKKEN